jgi:hypothetical protein
MANYFGWLYCTPVYKHRIFAKERSRLVRENERRQLKGSSPEPPSFSAKSIKPVQCNDTLKTTTVTMSYVIAAISNSGGAPEQAYRKMQSAAACPERPFAGT